MKDKKLLVTFLLFIIAMTLGWLLRLYLIFPSELVKYKHLLHAHSHVILLGWIFNAMYISITRIYYPISENKFSKLFWFIQATIILAMFGFLYQGYALFSILFSTLFLFGTFLWTYWIWKSVSKDKSIGGRFILLAFILLVLSSFGPLSLGAIMSTSLKTTPAYPLSIYFYLHFLYNGFFILGLLGVGFKYLDNKGIKYNQQRAKKFYQGMAWSIFPLYALSAIWINASIWINLLGAIAAIIQIWGGVQLYKMIKVMDSTRWSNMNYYSRLLIRIVGLVFSLKLILQLVSSIQWVSNVALQTKSYLIIGYIHLIMLGLISIFILWYLIAKKWIKVENRIPKLGLVTFLLGVFISETLLFSQGFLAIFELGSIPNHSLLLLSVSALMPVGIILLTIGFFSDSTSIVVKIYEKKRV